MDIELKMPGKTIVAECRGSLEMCEHGTGKLKLYDFDIRSCSVEFDNGEILHVYEPTPNEEWDIQEKFLSKLHNEVRG